MTHFKGDPARLDEMTSRLDEIREKLKAIEGGVANWAVWNDDASGVAFAVYDSEAAEAATPHIQGVWAGLADLLIAPPDVVSYSTAEKLR